ncbi:acyltransferase family protein [Leyella stercorea]|uniref:acyltransferase family protein n=1 Tax=Leyella stercorea TaxID=363265 RepID=UPI003AB01E70
MVIERNSQESFALDMLRFPLAALVVLLLTSALGEDKGVTYYLANYVNAPIVQIAIPAFFFMSGYLFFCGKEEFSWTVYKKKISKKVRSLFVPYVIWNYIALLLSYAYSYCKTGSIGDVMPWNLHDIIWSHGDGIMATSVFGYQYPVIVSPAAGVLWFMRDLMVMMLCSIVGFYIVKRLKWWIFPLLIFMNVFGIGVPIAGFSLAAITFFYMGAFFSIHQIHIFDWLSKYNPCFWLLLWPIMVVVQFVAASNGMDLKCISSLVLLSGIAFVFVIAYNLANKKNKVVTLITKWGETSFFIYTFGNTLILWFVNKDVGYLLESIPYCGTFLNYEFLFMAKVIECIVVYYIMKKFTPSLLSVLIGGRINKRKV